MVQSALLLPIDNPPVGRTLSAKPKIQSEQSESQHSDSFARHLEKTREHQTKDNEPKPTGKLTKRQKPEPQSTAANPPVARESSIKEVTPEKQMSVSTDTGDSNKDQPDDETNLQLDVAAVAPLNSDNTDAHSPIDQLTLNAAIPVDEQAIVVDSAVIEESIIDQTMVDQALVNQVVGEAVIDESAIDKTLIDKTLIDKSLTEAVVKPELSNDQAIEAATINLLDEGTELPLSKLPENSGEIVTETVAEQDPVATPLSSELTQSIAGKVKSDVQTTIDAETITSPVVAKSGTELPQDLTLESDSTEADLPDIEMSGDDLLVKSDDKTSKSEQFKLLMSQLNPADQKPQDKPLAPLVNSATPTQAQVASELAPASRLFVPQTQLGMSAAHPNWGKAMGEKIMWMANQQLSSADIRLDPPELGSLQVKIHMSQDQASVTFVSPHPQVRELLDQQVTRLREMFAEQGLQLGQVNVSDRQEQQSRQSDDQPKSRGGFASDEPEEVQVTAVSSLYLVDQFV